MNEYIDIIIENDGIDHDELVDSDFINAMTDDERIANMLAVFE